MFISLLLSLLSHISESEERHSVCTHIFMCSIVLLLVDNEQISVKFGSDWSVVSGIRILVCSY